MKNEMDTKKYKKHGKWRVLSDLKEDTRKRFEKQFADISKDNSNPQSWDRFLNDREIIYQEDVVEFKPVTLEVAIGVNDADSKCENPQV